MATPPKSTGKSPSGTVGPDSPQPAPGQASKLAASLAAKAKGKTVQPPPLIQRPGTKGGRLTVAEESAAHLARSGLVAVPAEQAGAIGGDPVQPPAYVVTPEFVGEVTDKLLKGIESWDVQRMTHRAHLLCGEKKLAEQFGESFAAPPGRIDTIAKSMMEISRKSPGLPQWAPEFAAAGAAGAWVLKRADGEKAMLAMEARVREQLEGASAPGLAGQTGAPAKADCDVGGDSPKPNFKTN